jgi:hypothetical protein
MGIIPAPLHTLHVSKTTLVIPTGEVLPLPLQIGQHWYGTNVKETKLLRFSSSVVESMCQLYEEYINNFLLACL